MKAVRHDANYYTSKGLIPRAYGWKPSLPDKRDFKYNVPYYILESIPSKLDLDANSPGAPFDPCWDQSNVGACGPNTLGENIVFDDLLAKLSNVMPSRLFMYYNTRLLMGTVDSDSGVDNRTMLKALAQYGWCDESLWPYDISQFTKKPPQAAYDQASQRSNKIQYLSINQDLDTMKGCIAEGFPFIFGFTVYESLETQQVDKTGDVPMPSPNEKVLGGHDILIVGYDDTTQRFKFKNHWTPQWGKNGYGTIPYAYATSPNYSDDFWTVRATGLVPTPTPDPGPGPGPGPGPTGNPDKATIINNINKSFASVESKYPGWRGVTIVNILEQTKKVVETNLANLFPTK